MYLRCTTFNILHFMILLHWEHDELCGCLFGRIDKFNFHLKTHLKLLVAMRLRYLSYVCYIFYAFAVNMRICAYTNKTTTTTKKAIHFSLFSTVNQLRQYVKFVEICRQKEVHIHTSNQLHLHIILFLNRNIIVHFVSVGACMCARICD